MTGQMKFIMFGCILLVVPTATILIITYGLEPKVIYKDCSALYIENEELKKELDAVHKLAKSEKYWRDSYNVFWVEQLKNHREKCEIDFGWPSWVKKR